LKINKEKKLMLDFLGINQNHQIGIDIGTSGIKIVEIEHTNKKDAILKNYVSASFRENLPQRDKEKRITKEEVTELLKMAIKEGGIKTKNASFSIPSFSSFLSFVTMPKVSEADIQNAITNEAKKFIPVSLKEVVLGWEVIEETANKEIANIRDENKMKVLLLAVPKDIVSKYNEIAQDSGLKMKNLEVEAFPLTRALVSNNKKTLVIVDIGSRVCNILIVSNGNLRGARNIGVGGDDLTDILSRSIDINYERAEELKRTEGLLNRQVSELLTPVIGNITNELKRVIAVYKSKNPQKEIEEIILSGGTASLKGIVEFFYNQLRVHTVVGDPWKNLIVENRLKPAIIKKGASFSIAIGLALKKNE